jgi:hypothetical protein
MKSRRIHFVIVLYGNPNNSGCNTVEIVGRNSEYWGRIISAVIALQALGHEVILHFAGSRMSGNGETEAEGSLIWVRRQYDMHRWDNVECHRVRDVYGGCGIAAFTANLRKRVPADEEVHLICDTARKSKMAHLLWVALGKTVELPVVERELVLGFERRDHADASQLIEIEAELLRVRKSIRNKAALSREVRAEVAQHKRAA